MKLTIDFETRSDIDLKKQGLAVYAHSPFTDILCMAYKVGLGPTKIWKRGEPFPSDIDVTSSFFAQNSAFEYAIWNLVGVKKYGWPRLPLERLHCTLAMALTHALPGSLEKMAPALGIEKQKDMAGNRVMLQLSRPRKVDEDGTITWWTPEEVPEKFEKLYAYCIQDVEVEAAADEKMLPLIDSERELFLLDHKINNRGVQIDIASVKKAMEVIEEDKKRLDAEMMSITGGKVKSANAAKQITEFLESFGVVVDDVTKTNVIDLLKNDLNPVCRRVLEIRQEGAKSSNAKLNAMLLRASADGRVRGVHQYHGAGTGRWSGRGIQTQNLPRPNLKQKDIEGVIANLHKGAEYIDMFYGAPSSAISDCIRSFITAAKGKTLLVVDFASIEARVLAWLAGQESVLEVFRTHGKIYEAQAASIYNVRLEDVTKDQRQIGKVAILALGYQGGVGAFQSMAKNYGVVVSDKRADEIKVAWRNANPKIVKYWYELDNAAINAVLNPSTNFKVGNVTYRAENIKGNNFLLCRLPSGRILYYPYPKLETNKFGRESVTYKGEDAKTKKWIRMSFYGGLAAENITQAVARDLLAHSMMQLEKEMYEIVMHVHDEIVCEVDENFGTLNNMITIVCKLPAWANGLPIAAEGFASKRYRK